MLEKLDLSQADRQKLFYDNARRILNLRDGAQGTNAASTREPALACGGETCFVAWSDLVGHEHLQPGARDIRARIQDLDREGIWGEVIYPSLGLWNPLITDPELVRIASRAENEWIASEIQGVAPDRLVVAHASL